jgi:hypothetical protein
MKPRRVRPGLSALAAINFLGLECALFVRPSGRLLPRRLAIGAAAEDPILGSRTCQVRGECDDK